MSPPPGPTPKRRRAKSGQVVGLQASVQIQVRGRDGKVKTDWCSGPDDVANDNFIKLIEGLLSLKSGASVSASLIAEDNTTNSISVYSPSTTGTIPSAFRGDTAGHGLYITLGDGSGVTPTPTRTAFNLVNERFAGQPSPPDRNEGLISMAASFVNGSGSTITVREIALKWRLQTTGKDFLMFWEDTPDIPVADGDSVTATYRLSWP